MSNSLKIFISALLLVAFCGACGKDPETTGINGVYVAGFESNAQGKRVAKYWKDGAATDLSDGATNAVANSIYCTDKDVFVAGYETNAAGKKVAVVWKNGVPNKLTNGTTDAVAKSVYVASQFFVMVAGEENGQARLWQNGESQPLEAGPHSSANSVFVDVPHNSDVYVAGYDSTSGSSAKAVATYWKNGKSIRLTDATIDCFANSIFISGTDVYVAGTVDLIDFPFIVYASLWKNGVMDPLYEYAGVQTSEALSVYGNPGTDQVWVAGTYFDGGLALFGATHPTVWEAGETGAPIKLEDGLGLEKVKRGNAIFYPEKGQQYVAGSITNSNNNSIAVYWHNLAITELTDGNHKAEAKSIFVKI